MKKVRPKKLPTRDDLASALKTIRDQSQIIELQARTISHREAPGNESRAGKKPAKLKRSQARSHESLSRYIN